MDTKFAWSTTKKGEQAILYNNYLYHLKRENKNTSSLYVCTFKSCSRSITLKNNVIIKSNDENHNHEPKLSENVQRVFCGLKRRVLDDVDQPITISHRYIYIIKDTKDSSDEE
ncbi:unnamed protein product [Rotaria sp. Silwood2]|nr:unnamed protein product [Rotaria sp. Silwood2]